MANIRKTTPELKITVGAEYNYQDKQVIVGKKLQTQRIPRLKSDGTRYEEELIQSTGVVLHGASGEGYLTPQSEPPTFASNTTTIGSGSIALNVSGTGTTCENMNYPGYGVLSSGINPHYGYIFLENLEPTSGNYIHWGLDIKGANSIIDGIQYSDFVAVGMMHPGDKTAFRLQPSGTNIRFISASGLKALSEGTVSNRTARISYTLFPR